MAATTTTAQANKNAKTSAKAKAEARMPAARTAAAQERLDQIVSAAVKVINESGLTGFSLPAVAAEVGISHVGVLHYVGSKNGLLLEVVKRAYDKAERQTGYVASFRPGGAREGERPNLPEYCRIVVEENSARRELVLLFHTLARPDEVDLLAEWARFEDLLFPLPQWEGRR